jgi:hypothetical protein
LFILGFGWHQKKIFTSYGISVDGGILNQDFTVMMVKIECCGFSSYPVSVPLPV